MEESPISQEQRAAESSPCCCSSLARSNHQYARPVDHEVIEDRISIAIETDNGEALASNLAQNSNTCCGGLIKQIHQNLDKAEEARKPYQGSLSSAYDLDHLDVRRGAAK